MTEKQKEYYDAVKQHGGIRQAARALGLDRNTVREGYKKVKAQIEADPAIKESMFATGTELVPQLAWAKTKSEDGISYSVLLKPEKEESEEESRIEEIIDRVKDIPAVPEIDRSTPEGDKSHELCNVIPLFDVHMGQLPENLDSPSECQARLEMRMLSLMHRMPQARKCIIINGGDFLHADDNTNLTPSNKNPLDVQGRHYDRVDISIEALCACIEKALAHHESVRVESVPGNHDPNAWIALLFAVAERYRDNPRVTITRSPLEFFATKWGSNLICGHHGHKRQPKDLVMHFASEFHHLWGETEHRHMFTGHWHHLKAQDFPGMTWEAVRPVTVRDHYAASSAYGEYSELMGITYHKELGEVNRVRCRLG